MVYDAEMQIQKSPLMPLIISHDILKGTAVIVHEAAFRAGHIGVDFLAYTYLPHPYTLTPTRTDPGSFEIIPRQQTPVADVSVKRILGK